jgi:hypothetical protein
MPLGRWQASAKLAGVTRDHAPWMDIQLQRGRSPPVLRTDIVALEPVAGMVGGKGGIPVVNVVSVMPCIRIVIHQTNVSQSRQ